MREIKFRARHKEYWEMHDWWSITANTFVFDDIEDPEYEFMQYTWLKDKNWKEIYEGDVIVQITPATKWCWEKCFEEFLSSSWWGYMYVHPSVIYWSEEVVDSIVVTIPDIYQHSLIDPEEYEIAWNIYENPELLSDD